MGFPMVSFTQKMTFCSKVYFSQIQSHVHVSSFITPSIKGYLLKHVLATWFGNYLAEVVEIVYNMYSVHYC